MGGPGPFMAVPSTSNEMKNVTIDAEWAENAMFDTTYTEKPDLRCLMSSKNAIFDAYRAEKLDFRRLQVWKIGSTAPNGPKNRIVEVQTVRKIVKIV